MEHGNISGYISCVGGTEVQLPVKPEIGAARCSFGPSRASEVLLLLPRDQPCKEGG